MHLAAFPPLRKRCSQLLQRCPTRWSAGKCLDPDCSLRCQPIAEPSPMAQPFQQGGQKDASWLSTLYLKETKSPTRFGIGDAFFNLLLHP
jgi:hypothetical protein